jgi:hypothetical protein
VQDSVSTAASLTAILLGIQIDAVARSDTTVTQTLSNSGENQSYTFLRDVTTYFQTNFTSTSHTLGARVTATGQITDVVSAKLIITYEYNDTGQTTRIKTVKIPIDGNNGSLTATLANVGAASQIPALDTFLPEASKVYRDIFFEVYGHTGISTALTGRYNLNMRYDSATTITTGHRGDLNSDCTFIRRDKLISGGTPSFTTSTTQNVEASTSSTNAPFPCLGGLLVVTYEYNHSTSTRVINSVELPAVDEAGYVGGTTVADTSEFERNLIIEEPGTITLEQSGVLMSCIDAGAITMDIRNGTQTSRVYSQPTAQRCGGVFFMRRLDSGATGSSGGYTFDRGFNTLSLTYFTTSATAGNIGTNVSGTYFINYTSDIAADGDGTHNHTTKWLCYPYTASSLIIKNTFTQNKVPIIPETSFYTTGVGFQMILYTINGLQTGAFCLQAELAAGEGFGAGWYDFYSTFFSSDTENGQQWVWARARDEFKRHPLDLDTDRMNIETSRSFRFDSQFAQITPQIMQVVSYHSFVYPITVTIQNSTGGTVTVNLHRGDTGEMVLSTSRTGDGDVTFNWYSDTMDVYAVAIDSTGDAVTDLAGNATTYPARLLDFAGGGGGPTYYAYSG